MNYADIRKLDVSKYVEKKNGLSYLSWAWAVDQLLLVDPSATWEYRWVGDVPFARIGETCMVFCTVTCNGIARTAQLPVMDHRNRAIPNPDAFQVNTAMQRCLAKAIALHGIGLYIYSGEDLPPSEDEPNADIPELTERQRFVRKIADDCIAMHAKAEVMLDTEGDTRGFWALYEHAAQVTDQEERLMLWDMLKMHSKVRSALKEYKELDAKERAKLLQKEAA